MGLGNNDTGVIAKTDRAMIQLRRILTEVTGALQGKDITIAGLQFDVFVQPRRRSRPPLYQPRL